MHNVTCNVKIFVATFRERHVYKSYTWQKVYLPHRMSHDERGSEAKSDRCASTSLPVKVPVLSKQAMSILAASFNCPGYRTMMPLALSFCSATTTAKIMTAGTPAGIDMTTASRNLKPAEDLRSRDLGVMWAVGMYMIMLMMKAKR